MKVKEVVAVITCVLTLLFGEETNICTWNANTYYNAGEVVLFQGRKYFAEFDDKGTMPYQVNSNEQFVWHLVDNYDIPIPSRSVRMAPISHIQVSYMLSDDPFVSHYVKRHLPFGFISLRAVGLSREKAFINSRFKDYLHSSWKTFMVTEKGTHKSMRTLRNHEFYREYLNYKDTTTLKKAFRQIIHNIGDAGTAFGHALSDYLEASGNVDARELANELAISDYINNPISNRSNRQNLMTTYFLGTIYDAIDLYEKRTRVALEWARINIPKPSLGEPCFIPFVGTANCLVTYYDQFQTLIHGNGTIFHNGEPVYGVTRSAMAVGRFIMIDAILARLPLQDMRITPSATNIGLDYGASLKFTAFARDPDAIRFELRDGTQSDPAKRYRIQHDPNAHDMFYQWRLTDKDGNTVRFPSVQTKTDSLVMTVIDSSGITGEEDKKSGFLGVRLSDGAGNTLNTTIRVENSQFAITARFQDDEGDTAFISRNISVFNRLPEANFQFFRGNQRISNPHILLVQRKDFGEHRQANGYSVHSGFRGVTDFEPLYICGLPSWDPDGNESDQIVKIEYDIYNNGVFEWALPGINQSRRFPNSHGFDGFEDRFVLRSSFKLITEENGRIKGNSNTYYLSSTWNNTHSPVDSFIYHNNLRPNRNHVIRYRVTDNENSSVIGTIPLPILAPPRIDSVEIGTRCLCSGEIAERRVGQTETILVVSSENAETAMYFYASATDEDDIVGGSLAYYWGVRDRNNPFLSPISLTNPNWEGNISGANEVRTYQELIDIGLLPGIDYEIILKVVDNDNAILSLQSNDLSILLTENDDTVVRTGISMMRVGSIRLE
ncbi:MAG: hypothetical protein FWE23_00245 [Chitinivibrionia bacterium]|nr:hypothetical protein [Chitinivibrionia bacterium]